MVMRSFLINSNYVEPKFPPCEEYSQHGYFPGIFQRPEATEELFPTRGRCTQRSPPVTNHPNLLVRALGTSHRSSPPGASMLRLDFRTICRNQTILANPSRQAHSLPVAKTRNQSPSSGKEPVVYPWMKKVHVNAASFVPLLLVNPSYTGGKPKHSSTAYMRQQVLELEKEFHYNCYFTGRRRVEIAHSLCLSQCQIKIWFQNQGMKWKKDHKLPNTKI